MRQYLRLLDEYFGVTNFFLVITMVVGMYATYVLNVSQTVLLRYLVVLWIGIVYTTAYGATEEKFIQKIRINPAFVAIIGLLNIGMFLYVQAFMVRYQLEEYANYAIISVLFLFDIAILCTFTPILQWKIKDSFSWK